jgi:tRNA (cmo5U34)-methyltransferase
MSIGQAFDSTVEYYDEWVRIALPNYPELFAVSVDLIPFDPEKPIDVLDLGAGTGLFSMHVSSKLPRARFVLLDVAPGMLDVARARFHKEKDRFRYVVGDYRQLEEADRYHLVISSLSIHHLLDEEKRALFTRIYAALKRGGVFINIDQIKGPTPDMQEFYWKTWLDRVRRSGAAEDRIQGAVERRTRYDKDALLTDQVEWLREAGFARADCVFKSFFVGVFHGVKE